MDSGLVHTLLKEIEKRSSILLSGVPPEFLHGENVDLHRWTLVLKDDDVRTLADQNFDAESILLDPSKRTVPEIFEGSMSRRSRCKNGLLSVNLSNAREITNPSIIRLVRRNVNLKEFNISGCMAISDASIRELGMHCRQLTSLNLSSCPLIDGSGFLAIAECCKLLRKLDISNCRGIQKWGMSKIFYECQKLEDVNVSHLKEVGDDEVRVLAQNCRELSKLVAKESPYISDQGVLSLVQYCPDLDYLDVSRTQMAFRITDVCMLGLGQRAASLRVLKLAGCDPITDVGLGWLAEGCHVLEELDISGCNRITDAGMRSLGNGCQILKSLNISQAKTISDIGVKSVTSGCPLLTTFLCAGVSYLSDPRLTIPRKRGAKLANWQNAIGVAAVAHNCPNLEHVDFSGCFKLDISIRAFFPMLLQLKTVNLAGLKEMSEASLVAMTEACHLIRDLNLSDCTLAVTGLSMKSVGSHCPDIKTLSVARCEQVRAGAIQGIVLLQRLERLDMSGCKQLTDDMLLPLSAPSTLPILHHLSLVNCEHLTDRTTSWIAAKVHDIYHLGVRGTLIRKGALALVRDSFPNSDLIVNENFVGFFPKARIEDRSLIGAYGRMKNGIILFQARTRGYRGRQLAQETRRGKERHKAYVKYISAIMVFMAKQQLKKLRKEHYRRVWAATKIAGFYRVIKAKQRTNALRARRQALFLKQMACRIQLRWRIHRAKCELSARVLKRENLRRRRARAALTLQNWARMLAAKRRVAHMKALRRARATVMNRKAIVIQRVCRGRQARLRTAELKRLKREHEVLRWRSASRIQYALRRRWLMKVLDARIAWKQKVYKAATLLQSRMRGYLTRLVIAEAKKGIEAVNRDAAAITIQYCWFLKKARLQVAHRRVELAKLAVKRGLAATVITKHVRSMWARMILTELKERARDAMRARAELEIWAAIKIQAMVRGVNGRLLFDEKVRERKGVWKELFDDEKKKRFFYNKLTGEIRWKIPQDLLDLLPRPKCDNCGFYEAKVECAVCNEFYCNQCWEQVHYGGRRKNHEFRALYDYYDKRMDYGDDTGADSNEFPSKWPSDIVADAVHGWMLRVAPMRAPVSVVGDWEQYTETDPPPPPKHKQLFPSAPAVVQTFYFNRRTFEATYDLPPELATTSMPDAAQVGVVAAEDGPLAPDDTEQQQWWAPTGDGWEGEQSQPQPDQQQLTEQAHLQANPNALLFDRFFSDQSYEAPQENFGGYYDVEGNWITDDGL